MSVCRNCDATLEIEPRPAFCPRCGQSTALVPDALAIAREFVARYLRTLVMLVSRPGRLTQEFLAGRRLRYVSPLRLYLNASLLFFLLVKVLGFSHSVHLEFAPIDGHGHAIRAEQQAEAYAKAIAEMQGCVDHEGSCSWWHTQGSRFGLKTMAQAAHSEQLVQRFLGFAPYAIFALLPAFALLLTLAYRRRGMRYGEHFVLSLHLHCVGFLALLAVALLPAGAAALAALAFAAHALLALHRVYGGRWWALLVRALPMSALYGVALLVTIALLFVVSIVLS